MNQMRDLVKQAKSQGGYISYLDVLEYLPSDIVEQNQIDDIVKMLKDMGIEVRTEKAEVINLSEDNKN